MASKFEKEEKLYISDFNNDDSGSDGELNNSKVRSRSSSPTAAGSPVQQLVNDTTDGARTGGPCSSTQGVCDGCKTDTKLKTYIAFQCNEKHALCDNCANSPRCPIHRQSKRKQ